MIFIGSTMVYHLNQYISYTRWQDPLKWDISWNKYVKAVSVQCPNYHYQHHTALLLCSISREQLKIYSENNFNQH